MTYANASRDVLHIHRLQYARNLAELPTYTWLINALLTGGGMSL